MIGKISKGAGFKGCVNYVLGKPEARLLAAEGVLTDSIQTITDCFQAQRMMKPNIRQPVGHISLSYALEDAPRMTDEMLVSLAKEYMQKMGIKDTQYIIARHNDQKHPHVHIVFNRVNNNGRIMSDKNDCYRNVKVCKELKEKYGLYFGKGKDRVRTHRLKGNDKTKYEIYHAVKSSLSKSNSWKQLISELSRQGIKTEFKYRGRSNVIQGLSFTKDGITFKASDIDRSFSYSKLDRMLGETNNQYQQNIGVVTNSSRPVMQYENTYNSGSNVVESIVGVLGGLFNPTPNYTDENAEAAFQRKLKKNKKNGLLDFGNVTAGTKRTAETDIVLEMLKDVSDVKFSLKDPQPLLENLATGDTLKVNRIEYLVSKQGKRDYKVKLKGNLTIPEETKSGLYTGSTVLELKIK